MEKRKDRLFLLREAQQKQTPDALIRKRAIALGLLLIPPTAYLVTVLEWALYGPYLSSMSLFSNAVFLLFLLVGANSAARRFVPAAALHQSELMVVYLMVSIATGVSGMDLIPLLNQLIPHGAWYNHQHGLWDSFIRAFPSWLVINDVEAVRGHFQGNDSFFRPRPLRAWAGPIFWWTCFASLLFGTGLCISVLVRRQWQDRERLTFPVISLPLQMTEPTYSLYRNKGMWLGFAIAASLGLHNGIAFHVPALPPLPIQVMNLKSLFAASPWNAIDNFKVTLYPLAIGIGYLLPQELLLSCWVFYLFFRGEFVVARINAWDTTPEFPFLKEQGLGALLGLSVFYLFTARKSLADAWRAAWEPAFAKTYETGREAISYRTAFLGLFAGFSLLTLFLIIAGLRPWVAFVCIAVYFLMVSGILRIRAEFGPPVHDFHYMGPDRMLPHTVGASRFSVTELTIFALLWFCNRAHRGDVAPVGLEGLAIGERNRWNARRIFVAMLLAFVFSVVTTFIQYESYAYRIGESSKFSFGSWAAAEAFTALAGWVGGVQDARPNYNATLAISFGVAMTWLLGALRLRFIGFPLHPIAFAIASGLSIHIFWLPLFIAWAIKALLFRFGGLAAYKRYLPFFLGLIIGDCFQGVLWSILSVATGLEMYSFYGE